MGEWKRDSVEENIRNLNENSQKLALIAQLKYHSFVLKSKSDKVERFYKSCKQVENTITELKDNLLSVIEYNEAIINPVQKEQ